MPKTVDDPLGSAAVNETGSLNVLEAARGARARRVVFASSSAVYGDDPTLPKREQMPPRPLTPYAVQKLVVEYYLRVYQSLYGLETVGLRFFNVFGPRQDPSSPYSGVISIFMNKALSGELPVIYGDGRQSRDFVFVGDVVQALVSAAKSASAPGKVFNVGTGKSLTIGGLWEMIAGLSGCGATPVHKPAAARGYPAFPVRHRFRGRGSGVRSTGEPGARAGVDTGLVPGFHPRNENVRKRLRSEWDV